MKKKFSLLLTAFTFFSFLNTRAQDLFISGGHDYSMSVCQDGRILVWGNTRSADGVTIVKVNTPTPIEATQPDVTFTQADAGSGYHLLALDCNKNVWAYGLNDKGQLGQSVTSVPNWSQKLVPVTGIGGQGQLGDVIYVSGSDRASYALLSNGRLVSWGDNGANQLGRPTASSPDHVPGYVLSSAGVPLENIIQVDAGDETVYALGADGTVYSWGSAQNGALGRADNNNQFARPVLLQNGTPLKSIKAISGGDRHGLALDGNGFVWSWGGDWGQGQLGTPRNSTTPGGDRNYADQVLDTDRNPMDSIVQIAAGQASSMLLHKNGRIITFGSNTLNDFGNRIPGSEGVLGTNSTIVESILPQFVKDCNGNILRNISQISDGDAVTYAVAGTTDRSIYVMGTNLNGELGLGDNNSRQCATRLNLAAFSCSIPEPCPDPDLGGDIPVCDAAQISSVVLSTRYSPNYTYKWYFRQNSNGNFTPLNVPDTNSIRLTASSKQGQYMVEVQRTYNNCSTCGIGYDTITVDQPQPLFQLNNGIFCKENSLTFSVTGNGQFNWYKTREGGNLEAAFTNKTSVTVPISELQAVFDGIDTVYNMYVEDVMMRNGTVLPFSTSSGNTYPVNFDTDANSVASRTMYFDVYQTVRLESIALQFFNYQGNNQNSTVGITIYKSNGDVAFSRPSVSLSVPPGTPGALLEVPVQSTPLAPGLNYRIVITGSGERLAFYQNHSAISLPANSGGEIQGYVSIRRSGIGGNSIPAIYNWKFSAQGGYPCGRARVSMTKDCPCNKPDLTLSSSSVTPSFCGNLNQTMTLKVTPDPLKPTIEPFSYRYQWYRNASPMAGKTNDTLFLRSASGAATYTIRVGHSSLVRPKCYTEKTVDVTIEPPITGNNITSGSDTICQNSNAREIQGSLPGGTNFSYSWVRSSELTRGYTAIPSTDTRNYSPGAVQTSTYFRRVVNRGVCTDTSAAVRVVVDPAITDPGVLSGNPPVVCSGSAIPSLVFSAPTGGTPPLRYQWERSTDQTNWTVMSQENQAALINLPVLTQRTYFRRKVFSLRCNSMSAVIPVGVDTAITNNTFADSSANQKICRGETPVTIKGNLPRFGVKPYEYRWEQSESETGPFTAIPSSNTPDYAPPAITTTTFYRRVVVSTGACANSVTSQTAKVVVDPVITAGTIQPSQPLICAGTAPVLNNLDLPTGGTAPYSYRWQRLSGNSWVDVPTLNPSSASFTDAPSIDDTTSFRRIVLSAIKCQAISAPVTVNTTGQMLPGEIRVTDTAVCAGQTPGVIQNMAVASGGTGTTGIVYRWEKSTNGTNWQILPDTSRSLNPGPLNADTWFRRRASNGTGVCDEVYAGPVLIKQYKPLNGGIIQDKDTSICDGSSALVRSLAPASNGSPVKTYSWVIARFPDLVYKDTAVNSPTLALTGLTRTVKVKRIVTDACGRDTSDNEVTINVFPKDVVQINITTDHSQTVCSDKPLTVRVSVRKAGNRTITWEYDGQTFAENPDSVLVIQKPRNGAKVKAISVTDPTLICTTPRAESQEITLSIHDPVANNSFGTGSAGYCRGSLIQPIIGGSVTGGVIPRQYQWLASESPAGPFTPVTGATDSSFTPSITKTTYYKRIVTSSGVCKRDTSANVFEVFIDQPVQAGTISLDTGSLCSGDTVRFTNTQIATGGTQTLAYSWDVSLSPNGPWTRVDSNTTFLKYPKASLDSIRNTFYFRRRASSAICSDLTAAEKTVICQKPYVKNFSLGRTCAFTERPFNILDTVIDIEKRKGDFSTNGWRLYVDSIKYVSDKIETFDFQRGTPGSFTYKSKQGYVGNDTVVFKICEDAPVNAQCVTKAFYFRVLPVNRPPVVKSEIYTNYKNQFIEKENILANDEELDGDTLYVWPSSDQFVWNDSLIVPYKRYIDSVIRKPSHGTVTMNNRGDITFRPEYDYVGTDTAVFFVCDFIPDTIREYCTTEPFYCIADTVVFDIKPYRIFIPEGFSPNDDGVNDLFVIRSEVPLDIDLKLYNRWGNLVYEKEGYKNDFDGKANRGVVIGEGLPDGTYYLYIDVHDKLQPPFFRYITISR